MVDFFSLLSAFWQAVMGKLADCTFMMFGYTVDLLSILLVFSIIAFVISVFWKGARA